MILSVAGVELIKHSEGLRTQVYRDIAGLPTIGYGHKLSDGESFPNGISEEQANALFDADVKFVGLCISRLVRVSLTQGQFDALVDFVFNLGNHLRT